MAYLILQILVCLLVAALIGIFIGWWLRRWQADKELADTQSNWQKRVSELQIQLTQKNAALFNLNSDLHKRDAKLQSLNDELLAKGNALKDLHKKFDELTVRLSEAELGLKEEKAKATALPSGQEFHEPKLRESLPEDDLKKISGIGPVLEKALNRLGYYRFRDIATWSDAEIEAVAKELNKFRGRIRRDEWVAQAKSLHQKKYGETP